MIPQSSLGLVDLKFPGSEAAKKMEEKAPNAILPTEIWHLIINNLERKGLARASMTCSTFRNIIETDEVLRKKLHLPSFDSISSRNVQLSGLNHNEAALEENAETDLYSYPSWNERIAYVVPTGNSPEIVHFRVTNPGYYSCVAVNEKQPCGGPKEKGDEDLDGLLFTLPVSYYRVGDVHTFGSQANYRSEGLDAANCDTGDIVSVWVDSFPKGSPPFSVSVSCPAPTSRLNPDAASCDQIPFCAFFKNGVMVHDPFTLEGLVSPVYICYYFHGQTDGENEKVEIVDAPFQLSLVRK